MYIYLVFAERSRNTFNTAQILRNNFHPSRKFSKRRLEDMCYLRRRVKDAQRPAQATFSQHPLAFVRLRFVGRSSLLFQYLSSTLALSSLFKKFLPSNELISFDGKEKEKRHNTIFRRFFSLE